MFKHLNPFRMKLNFWRDSLGDIVCKKFNTKAGKSPRVHPSGGTGGSIRLGGQATTQQPIPSTTHGNGNDKQINGGSSIENLNQRPGSRA